MDASISSDPHAPDIDDSFRAERYVRAGANPNELAQVAAAHAKLSPELRYAEASWIDTHSDGDLRERISGVSQIALLEQEALNGEWVAADPIQVGTSTFPLWNLANDWVGTRIGNALQGFHLVAPSLDALISEIERQVSAPVGTAVDVAAWQRAKHLADAKARATAGA